MGTESRADMLAMLGEKFGFERDLIDLQILEGIDPSELTQRQYDEVLVYASQIGAAYQEQLPESAIEAAFTEEIRRVANEFLVNAKERNGMYFNALSELPLVTQVDAAFATADEAHVIPMGNERDKVHRIFRGDLEGVQMTLQALESGEGIEEGQHYIVDATHAVWKFDHNGIRLAVYYIDPISGEGKEVQARMDFHYRDSGEYKDRPQAALDLEGAQMTRALRLSGQDYHRGTVLPSVIKKRDEFERLKQGRIGVARSLTAREFA